MAYRIQEIEGIGPTFGAKLEAAGITNTDHLLKEYGSRKGRKATAEKTGLDESKLLKWANMADLMRISGVDTIKELKMRRADNLTAKMVEVNTAKKLVRQVPSEAQVTKWVDQAKTLDPMISH